MTSTGIQDAQTPQPFPLETTALPHILEVKLDTQAVDALLARVQKATGDLSPLMVSIKQELLAQTEANFEAQGRPTWPALAASTIAQREKKKKWPGQILQVSGTLARSIVTESDETSAMVGVGAEVRHAAIHQFGGKAGRGHKANIPARAYLPLVGSRLQPEAEAAIVRLGEDYLHRVAVGEK